MFSPFSSFGSTDEAADELEERRVRVLKMHVEELTRQAEKSQAELKAVRSKLKALESQQAAAQPNERKLFARLEQLQAELKLAKEHKGAADARNADLAAQLEKVVSAAQQQTETPGQKLLLQVTTEQLETTQTALQQALRAVSDAER